MEVQIGKGADIAQLIEYLACTRPWIQFQERKKKKTKQALWCIPIIPAFGKVRIKVSKFKLE